MKVWAMSFLLICFRSVLSDLDINFNRNTVERQHEPILEVCDTIIADSFLSPCYMTDIECLSKSTIKFLEQTHLGNPLYGFVAIDPLNIAIKKVHFGGSVGLIYKYKNIVVTGLKHQSIADFKMDTALRSVALTTKADLEIVGDVAVEITRSAKNYAGSVTATGSVLGTATYNYELKDDNNGVRHFELLPETITCRVITTPEAQLNPELIQALSEDDDFKKISKENIEEIRSKAFCEIVRESYKSVIHNIRAAAKVLPASAFFTDI